MRISVICIGNMLLMDDGVGPACAAYMRSRYCFPDNVEVLDRACMGMAIINDLRECDHAVVLDAVEVPGACPGQVFSFAPQDVAPTPAGMTSLHDVRFADVLASAELLGIRCEGRCFGIQVENMNPSEFIAALTPRVAAALPLLAQAAVRYLREELGVAVRDLLEEGTAEPVLPDVYGEPDVSVMAGYLAQGLQAVGVEGVSVDPHGGKVAFRPPAGVSWAGIEGHAGLEVRRCDDEACPCWVAVVGKTATDVDCDRLVGACALHAADRG